MFYGDLHFVDILIFGGIAAFLFYRLRGVLGKRTGYEKKHDNRRAAAKPINNSAKQEQLEEAPDLEPSIKKLETAYEKIDNFNHVSFLEGAKSAFEIIVALFNEGNKDKLKPLLTKETFLVFSKTIDLNKEKNNNPNEDFDQPSFLDQCKLKEKDDKIYQAHILSILVLYN